MSLDKIQNNSLQPDHLSEVLHARGLNNAALQREKHKEKDNILSLNKKDQEVVNSKDLNVSSTPIADEEVPGVNQNAFELILDSTQNSIKITYSREELLKHLNAVNEVGVQSQTGKTEMTMMVELDLEEILKDRAEIFNTVVSKTVEKAIDDKVDEVKSPSIPATLKLSPLAIALKTANNLNLTISLRVGNDLIIAGANSEAHINGVADSDNGSDVFIIGNNSKVSIDGKIGTDNADDLFIVGNNYNVQITQETGIDNSSDIVIIGNNSEVHIKSSVGTDNGNDTIIMGNNSRIIIEGETGVDNGNDTIILGNNAELIYKGKVGVDNGNDTLILGNGARMDFEGQAAIDNGDTTLVVGNHMRVEMRVTIQEDLGTSLLLVGKNADKLLDETNKLGDYLNKFKTGGRSFQEVLDQALDRIKDAAKLFEQFKNHGKKKFDMDSSNNEWDLKLKLAMYRIFSKEMYSIEFISSFVSGHYKHAGQGQDLMRKNGAFL